MDAAFDEDTELQEAKLGKRNTVQLDKDVVAEKVIHARVKKQETKGNRATAHSMVAGSFTGGIRKSGLVYKRQASNNNRLRSSSRNSRNINQSIVDMVTDEKSFKEQFDKSRKKEVKLNKNHTFDSR